MRRLFLIIFALFMAASAAMAGDYEELLQREKTSWWNSWAQARGYPFFDLAYKAAHRGEAAQAIAWFEKGLARDQRAIAARYDLILIASGVGQPDIAIHHSNILIASRPDFGAAYLLRGLAYLTHGERGLAIADLRQALNSDNLLAEHFNLAQTSLDLLLQPQDQPRPAPFEPKLILAKLENTSISRSGFVAWDDPRLTPLPSWRENISWVAPAQPISVKATQSIPPPLNHNQLGFAALARGDRALAQEHFETSLEADPHQPLILRQMGFLQQAAARPDLAAEYFRRSLILEKLDADTAHPYRRAITQATDAFDLSAYIVYRRNALDSDDLALLGPSLAQSQGGIEAAYRPFMSGPLSAHRITPFARLLWGFDGNRTAFRDESVQGGIGVRAKPLSRLNLVASVERLVAIGSEARDDWMMRASYSHGQGYDMAPMQSAWWHWHVYSDAAVIDPADPDLLLSGEARVGRGFGLNTSGSSMFTPYMAAHALYQDAGQSQKLLEAGPGLWWRQWFNDSAHGAPASALDVRIEYRFKLAGDDNADSGLALTLAVVY